jgi:hypothetical protein
MKLPSPIIGFALAALGLLQACGLAEKHYNAAKEEPVRKVELYCKLTSVKKVGPDYKYFFEMVNRSDSVLKFRPDFELIRANLSNSYEHNLFEVELGPGRKKMIGFASKVGPASVQENGFKHFVFRAYTWEEELLVRQLHPVPEKVSRSS